jgi:homoserine dehydrogenase
MKTLKLGILGLGTVGTGVLQLLHDNRQEIKRRVNCEIQVVACAVKDKQKARSYVPDGCCITDDPKVIINDPQIDVVLELMGGDTLAYEWVMQALRSGKQVVTANKALIAKHGNALQQVADAEGVMLAFEAAVAGAIPIVKTLREGLAANQVQSLIGIINGTSNFILSHMQAKQSDFAESLILAQRMGYAEADPSFDIDGIDAAHKLTILASIAFGIPLDFDSVYCEGIRQIRLQDILFADELGFRIKQLAVAYKSAQGVQTRVYPALLPKQHILAHVNEAMNAIVVNANAAGQTLYYGQGAGALPTASAVVADLLDIVRQKQQQSVNVVPLFGFAATAIDAVPRIAMREIETIYYLRMHLQDKPGALAEITRILGNLSISIEVLLQRQAFDSSQVPVVILTHQAKEANIQQAIAEIERLPCVSDRVVYLRQEKLLLPSY